MRCPSALANESDRLKALAEYGLDSERPLPNLAPIVQLAVRAFDVPGAAVNMIGRDEVFFAASEGIGDCDKSRDVSFCAHAITQDDVLVIEDAKLDVRFHDNPLVTGPNPIRFYAGVPVRSPDGHALGALCLVDSRPHASFSDDDKARLKDLARLVADRLELRRLSVASELGTSKFERIAATSPNGIVAFDSHGQITAINPAAEAIFGHAPGSVPGQPLSLLLPAWRRSELAKLTRAPGTGGEQMTAIQQDFIGQRADGSAFPLEIAWSCWTEGEQANFGVVIHDVTQQRRQEDQLYRLANFDDVTGLPNLNLLHLRLEEEMAGDRGTAVIMLGIEGLQEISDALGHNVLLRVLQRVASRLKQCVRTTDIVARVGDSQFAIMLGGVGDPLRAREAAGISLAAISRLILVDGQEIRLAAHCGLALAPSHADSPQELVSNASLALQAAMQEGKGPSFMFVPALRMRAIARRLFDAELHQAVEREELQLYYQPQVRLADGGLAGAEALLRWNHPERGPLEPAAFLSALENNALAPIVGNWVIDTACRQAEQWREVLSPDFRMSVNVFAAQFGRGNLRSFIRSAIDRYNLPPGSLELEITETTVLDDEARFLPLLEGLRDDGIKLAFDDFGTGFASLSLVARYPLAHLKIDKSFVQRAFVSDKDRAIVQAITDLAHRLGLEVIAEGVESRRYLDFCKDIGCDEGQGYLFGKPVPAAEFEAACRRRYNPNIRTA